MVVVVVARQVVDVARADERAADLAREAHDPLVHLVLLGDAVDLDLHVDVLAAHGLEEIVEMGAGIGGALLDDPAREARLEAARQRDQALRVALQEPDVDVGLAPAESLEEAGRGELHQVAEALVGAREERQVVALAPAVGRRVVVDEVGLHADDRLDPGLLARLVVVDGAVHGAVIGDAERGHAELGGPLGHRIDRALRGLLLDLAMAVEQRILAVDVQMYDRSAQDIHLASGTRCQRAAFADFASSA